MSHLPEIKILLVEDSLHDAEMMLRVLGKREQSKHILHVKDGQEALDWLFGRGDFLGRDTKLQPRVVLLDLKMPKVNGLEVLSAIRCATHTAHLPVVMMTSSREPKDLIASYNLAVNSYVVKPIDFDRFSAAIDGLAQYWLQMNYRTVENAKGMP